MRLRLQDSEANIHAIDTDEFAPLHFAAIIMILSLIHFCPMALVPRPNALMVDLHSLQLQT